MKIGFNLLIWTTHVTEAHFPLFEKLKAVGYDGVEVPLFEGDVAHFEKVGQALKDAGLLSTTVTCIPDAESSVISSDPACRAKGLDHIKWALDCGQKMGAETMCGPFHQPLGVFSGSGATEDEKNFGAEVHRAAAAYGASAGTVLAIESLNRFECYFLNLMADANAYVKLVDHPNFGTMYDTFHSNIEEKDTIAAFTDNIPVINHIHISENDRGTPGKGHVPFAALFEKINASGYDRWLTIEAFGRALPDLAAATCVWRDFFPDAQEVYEEGFKMIKGYLK